MKTDRRGHTLPELIVVFGIFSLLLTVVAVLLTQSVGVYRRTNGTDTALREMRRARAALERDLVLASPSQIRRARVPASLGGGDDGEALWFLSPVDPNASPPTVLRKRDGTPFWQRNILYYLVVPNNHNTTFGMSCAGGTAANGYDDRCPHKVLIRKVIDSGVPTNPADETTEETLLPNVGAYTTRPNGYSLAGMPDPAPTVPSIVASHLLGFETFTAPPPGNVPTEVLVDLRALSTEEARREMRVGVDPAYTSRFTHLAPFSVFLRN